MDEGFISLRGKRKRAMYVLKHYRSQIPESPYLERPDQGQIQSTGMSSQSQDRPLIFLSLGSEHRSPYQ